MPLDPEKVYETARSLLPAAESFLKRKGLDPALAEDFLMETASHLTLSPSGKFEIRNLSGYLYTSFKHRVLEDRRKHAGLGDLSEKQVGALSDEQAAVRSIEHEILKEEILRHLKPEDKFILDWRLQGFSFKEISLLFNEKFDKCFAENALRTKYSRAVDQLEKKLRNQYPGDLS